MNNYAQIILSEAVGSGMLVLLGCGVIACELLTRSKGQRTGWLLISIGWGMAIFASVSVAYASGAQLNPAVTIAVLVAGKLHGTNILLTVLSYFTGQLLGAMIGAVLVWLVYKQHFDAEPEPVVKLGVFSTVPAIRSYTWNFVTEAIGTFVLAFVVIGFGRVGDSTLHTPAGLAALGALPASLLVMGVVASLGGPTGTALNPTRDLGPRIVHALLPIKGKGGSDWSYAWVPIVAPLTGGLLAGLAAGPLLPIIQSL